MKREIKFKFWLGHTKKMTYEHSLIDISHAHWDFTEDIIPLQFTGLLDKNGKEIYEGDILSFKTHKDKNNWASELVHLPEYADIVEFVDGCFRMRYSIRTVKAFIWDIVHHKIKAEIIGNIYEHPDLLTKNKEGMG